MIYKVKLVTSSDFTDKQRKKNKDKEVTLKIKQLSKSIKGN